LIAALVLIFSFPPLLLLPVSLQGKFKFSKAAEPYIALAHAPSVSAGCGQCLTTSALFPFHLTVFFPNETFLSTAAADLPQTGFLSGQRKVFSRGSISRLRARVFFPFFPLALFVFL